MTDKEKLEKIKKLADDMYYAAANLGSNVGSGERLRKTMEEYHQFIIYKYHKEEPVSEELEEAAEEWDESLYRSDAFKAGAKWQKEQMMAKAIDAEVLENYDGKVIKYDETILDEKLSDCKVFDKVKVIIIKED